MWEPSKRQMLKFSEVKQWAWELSVDSNDTLE